MIILDSSPLIHLTKIGKIEYLVNLFDYLIISETVYSEAIEKGIQSGYSDAKLLFNLVEEGKIRKWKVEKIDNILKGYLHPGEYESIQLASEYNRPLVMDEEKGRLVAEQRDLLVLTTVDILLLLLKERSISYRHYHTNFIKYSDQGWLGPNVLELYLEEGKKYE
ncbi:MAG: hypothetical protein ACOC4M_08490 [Promethearchaeia archaeon]